jgi:hypothetical protein
MIWRVFFTECVKLKRTLALWMVFIAPMVVVTLQLLVGLSHQSPIGRNGADPWVQITQNTIGLWTVLMMPLFVTLETSLLAGLEHADKNWKSLLALPAPRWTVYGSKLAVMIALLWAAHVVLIGGTILSATLLSHFRPELKLVDMPLSLLLRPVLRISASALLAVTIQHWVSLRWQSFTAALGFGMCAMVVSFVAVNSDTWGRWFPWSMPMYTMRAAAHRGQDPLFIAIGGAVIVAAIGAWEFSRREIV